MRLQRAPCVVLLSLSLSLSPSLPGVLQATCLCCLIGRVGSKGQSPFLSLGWSPVGMLLLPKVSPSLLRSSNVRARACFPTSRSGSTSRADTTCGESSSMQPVLAMMFLPVGLFSCVSLVVRELPQRIFAHRAWLTWKMLAAAPCRCSSGK